MRRLALFAVLLAAIAGTTGGERAGGAERRACPQQRLPSSYSDRVMRALRAKQDLWGNALLAAPDGPTYEGARRRLAPLLLARAPGKRPLTDSGIYYLPFAQPLGVQGAGSVALHVADGSQIVWQRIGGRELTIFLGRERYGSCLARLTPARLADGYLPILETRYVDAAGNRYSQESFAGQRPLTSFVRLTVDARRTAVRLRLGGLTLRVGRAETRTIYVGWRGTPRPFPLDSATYDAARRAVADYWSRRLAGGATIEVPEERVTDAARALLIQNLALTWRYSIGNPYEQFSFPEGLDVAQVMGEWGFGAVERAILRTSLTRRPTPYPNWKMGQKLLASASHYRLFRDRAYVDRVTPVLRGYVATLGRQIDRSPRGLLERERYSSDIPDSVYGLHSQAVAWQGLRTMGAVWAQTGRGALAARCRALAARLEVGLRRAVRASQRRLPDGSLFVPVKLLDGERPYGSLTEARHGSYWNLVMPYALASGLFRPGGREADGILRYMLRHGSRLLGLVRAGAYALYREPVHPTSGTDEVYGTNVARFLAANDEADQLVLSLYGQLAAAMAPGTFVSGEAASVAPLSGGAHRSMYLPPNGASNAAFLVKLRLMLVHETARGLELAFATPRRWLRPGRTTLVRAVPTGFGPVSFSIESRAGSVRVSLDVPDRAPPRTLKLRLRLPGGNRIRSVLLDGRAYRRFDARAETIDLSGLEGRLELLVGYS